MGTSFNFLISFLRFCRLQITRLILPVIVHTWWFWDKDGNLSAIQRSKMLLHREFKYWEIFVTCEGALFWDGDCAETLNTVLLYPVTLFLKKPLTELSLLASSEVLRDWVLQKVSGDKCKLVFLSKTGRPFRPLPASLWKWRS